MWDFCMCDLEKSPWEIISGSAPADFAVADDAADADSADADPDPGAATVAPGADAGADYGYGAPASADASADAGADSGAADDYGAPASADAPSIPNPVIPPVLVILSLTKLATLLKGPPVKIFSSPPDNLPNPNADPKLEKLNPGLLFKTPPRLPPPKK